MFDRVRRFAALVAAVALLAAACGDDAPASREGPTVTVGSFNFPESNLLAEIFGQALRAAGFDVEIRHDIGSREVIQPAIGRGEVDLVVEYTGNALRFQLEGDDPDLRDADDVHRRLQEELEGTGAVALARSDIQNVDGLAVTRAFAEEHGLQRISDLQEIEEQVVLGGPPECPERLSCLLGYEQVYGLQFRDFRPLDVAGPITVAALQGGEVQAAVLFTTQGVIEEHDFVLLEDDLGMQLPQHLVPVVSQSVVDAYGDDLTDLVDSVTAALEVDDLLALNRRVEVDNEDPDLVARDWLEEAGFLA